MPKKDENPEIRAVNSKEEDQNKAAKGLNYCAVHERYYIARNGCKLCLLKPVGADNAPAAAKLSSEKPNIPEAPSKPKVESHSNIPKPVDDVPFTGVSKGTYQRHQGEVPQKFQRKPPDGRNPENNLAVKQWQPSRGGKKAFIFVPVLIIALVVIVIEAFNMLQTKPVMATITTPTPTVTEKIISEPGKFDNKTIGYSMNYPTSWQISKTPDADAAFTDINDPTTVVQVQYKTIDYQTLFENLSSSGVSLDTAKGRIGSVSFSTFIQPGSPTKKIYLCDFNSGALELICTNFGSGDVMKNVTYMIESFRLNPSSNTSTTNTENPSQTGVTNSLAPTPNISRPSSIPTSAQASVSFK